MFKVLLYYKYVKLNNPQEIVSSQKELCKRLGLKGRILIGDEGINGTVSGSPEAVEEYKKETEAISEFEGIEWKESTEDKQIFPRLRVVYRTEIVTLGLKAKGKDADIEHKANYIEPEELKALYEEEREFYIIDARNEYEARIGKFKDAITFDVESFREIPEIVQSGELDHLKDKDVVLYCTGGIRCEKFSAFMKDEGFNNVRHLHGGIHMYHEKTGGKNFEGEMYVFDGRVSVPVNDVNPIIISECVYCDKKIARFINCHNSKCNKRIICCEKCEREHDSMCSEECAEFVAKHPELRGYRKEKAFVPLTSREVEGLRQQN